VSNDKVATFIKELVLKIPEGERVDFRAGAMSSWKHQCMKCITGTLA